MKPQGLLIAVVLLAGLSGLIWWSNKKQAAAKPADTTTKILTIPDDQFQGIRIKNVANQTVDLVKKDNQWTMTAAEAAPGRSGCGGQHGFHARLAQRR